MLKEAVKTLTRAVVAQKKVAPESRGLQQYEEYLMRLSEQVHAEYGEWLSRQAEEDREKWRQETGWQPPEDADAEDFGLG